MAMTAWSTVAANNVLANTGINMDEGMAPSALNDSIREIMAVLKTAIDTANITATGTTAALFNTTATTVNFAGAATTLAMGAGASATLNANFTTAINLNTSAVVSNQTTVAVFNTTSTTVNAFGAASVALNIGHASAAAAFPGGISIPTGKKVTGAGTATIEGFEAVGTDKVTAEAAEFKIVGGATSVSLRNNADSADNLLISDAGVISTRGTLSVVSAAAGEFVIPLSKHYRAANNAGNGTLPLIGNNTVDSVVIGGQTDSIDTGSLPRIAYWAAASLPAGNANRNGTVAVDGTNNRLIYYSGGNRYYIAGTGF